MNKWTYENEMNACTKILLNAYLATMHSEVITAIYTYENDVYAYDMTENDLYDLATVTRDKLQIKSLGKKRIEKILEKSEKFSTVEKMENLKNDFTKQNNGYIAEFLYRIEKNGETVENIKHSNNSKGYDLASDTRDNKQLKNLNDKATFTTYKYLIKASERKNYNDIENVKNAVKTLEMIFSK